MWTSWPSSWFSRSCGLREKSIARQSESWQYARCMCRKSRQHTVDRIVNRVLNMTTFIFCFCCCDWKRRFRKARQSQVVQTDFSRGIGEAKSKKMAETVDRRGEERSIATLGIVSMEVTLSRLIEASKHCLSRLGFAMAQLRTYFCTKRETSVLRDYYLAAGELVV